MKFCPTCKDTPASTERNFCAYDGTALELLPKCECGKRIWPYQTFCTYCGQPADIQREKFYANEAR